MRSRAAELILVGHAFAHADEIDSVVGGIETALAPTGLVAIDFHHVLGLVQGQFDVVAHTHRSYLSLLSLERALDRHGLGVVAATRTSDYGGTVRVLAAHASAAHAESAAAEQIRDAERRALVDRPAGYAGLEQRCATTCDRLVAYLDVAARPEGQSSDMAPLRAGRHFSIWRESGSTHCRSLSIALRPSRANYCPGRGSPVLAPSELARIQPDEI